MRRTLSSINAIVATAILMLSLSGCASGPPTAKELANADYGSPISQEDAEATARQFMLNNLKDPDSAEYQWHNVYTGWVRGPVIAGGKLIFGYILDVQVNAKNSFGGYTGYKPYKFLFKNGQLLHVYTTEDIGYGNTIMTAIY